MSVPSLWALLAGVYLLIKYSLSEIRQRIGIHGSEVARAAPDWWGWTSVLRVSFAPRFNRSLYHRLVRAAGVSEPMSLYQPSSPSAGAPSEGDCFGLKAKNALENIAWALTLGWRGRLRLKMKKGSNEPKKCFIINQLTL